MALSRSNRIIRNRLRELTVPVLLVAFAVSFFVESVHGQSDSAAEYEVKAAFLLNFVRFTQ